MTLSTRPISSMLSCLGLLLSISPGAAGEYGSRFVNNANRCSGYGPDYTAIEGSDVCARIGGRVRVELGTNAGMNPANGWGAGRASSAAMRVDSGAQGLGAPSHLRVQGGLEYPNPFR